MQKRPDGKLNRLIAQWHDIVAIMPPIRNVAPRDTLASIGQVPRRYDKLFAAPICQRTTHPIPSVRSSSIERADPFTP